METVSISTSGFSGAMNQMRTATQAAEHTQAAQTVQSANFQLLEMTFEPQKMIAGMIPPPQGAAMMSGIGKNLNVFA